jgi:hypothetical protein
VACDVETEDGWEQKRARNSVVAVSIFGGFSCHIAMPIKFCFTALFQQSQRISAAKCFVGVDVVLLLREQDERWVEGERREGEKCGN